jgi:adenylate cyclase
MGDVQMDPFRLGDHRIKPRSNEIDGQRVDSKAMNVLVCLADTAPDVVSHATLIERVWPGVVVGDNVLHQAITHLRKVLGDDARSPRYIENIPRRGYRLLVDLQPESGAIDALDRRGGKTANFRFDSDPLLAVLPFDNLSGDAKLAYFSDGMSEEILQTVARTTRIPVVGRTSSFQFRGAAKVVRRVADELKATHVMDGSVRRSGERVRISAQLIECATQTTLWSGRFERKLSDVFALQDEIARAVAHALCVAFTASLPIAAIDPIAFDLYLRARAGPTTYTGAHDVDLLEAAVMRDPRLAPAWAALALSLAIEARDAGRTAGALPESVAADYLRRARQAAEHALTVDPNAALAHAALAALEPVCGAFERSEAHLRRALAVSPDEPTVLQRMARFCRSVGRHSAAQRFAARAYEIDPLHPSVANDYATVLNIVGRSADADVVFDANRNRWLDVGYVIIGPLFIATYRGDWNRVDRLLADVHARGPHTPFVLTRLPQLDRMRRCPTDVVRARLTQLQEELSESGTVSLSAAAEACWSGCVEQAFAILERASFAHLFQPGGRLLAGDFGVHWFFDFDIASTDPQRFGLRFVQLCARLGLCDYWTTTDSWPDCAARLANLFDFNAEARRLAGVELQTP